MACQSIRYIFETALDDGDAKSGGEATLANARRPELEKKDGPAAFCRGDISPLDGSWLVP